MLFDRRRHGFLFHRSPHPYPTPYRGLGIIWPLTLVAALAVPSSAVGSSAGAVGTPTKITTFAGIGTPCSNPAAASPCGDGGLAADAHFTNPIDIQPIPAAQGGGYLVADEVDYMIREISADGTVSTAVGDGAECSQWAAGSGTSSATQTCGVPGPASGVELGALQEEGFGTAADVGQSGPTGADAAPSGGVLIADRSAGVVLASSTDTSAGSVSLLAGTGLPCQPLTSVACGDGGPAADAGLDAPDRVVPFDNGYLITEDQGNRVRWISPLGDIYTIAGQEDGTSCSNSPDGVNDCGFNGATGGTANNPQSVYLNAPNGAAVLPASGDPACPTNDACFVATSSTNDVVIQVDVDATELDTDPTTAIEAGTARIIAGDFTGNELSMPSDIAIGGDGTVIIADTYNQLIRQLAPTGPLAYGPLNTIAGTGRPACGSSTETTARSCGDGGPALGATFYTPARGCCRRQRIDPGRRSQ